MSGSLYGAVEAGGTKFITMVASGPDHIAEQARFDTATPEVVIPQVVDFFRQAEAQHGKLRGVGVGSFGPVDLDPQSPTFGYITATPKAGWSNTDLVGPLRQALDVPVAFDTDVNAAAVGEHRWGAAQGLDTFIYMTIGTGIGGGGMIGGRLMHGLIHPEMGHMRLPRNAEVDPFAGACPFHGDCLEGLASGPAIEKRWGTSAKQLGEDHQAWQLQADYLSLAVVNLVCTLSPQRVILGGGVMHQQFLLPMIRERTLKLLNNYVQSPAILDHIDSFIVTPGLGDKAGILGSLALALD
ncbi:ROK family protein [Aeoliella sp. ICT_H6.2]|uniref:fructokinase n=1 Tax=Aeoliella straminimaris TaxID=2954799 RepID=A0A9X2FCG6_9BACT|nr:ROK family protein [Aeoliella straminimaris]MCO6046415.1 ROK family protein [Aeoliella straminimaris]